MAKTETKYDFMPYWKNEQKCFEDAKVEGKDSRTGKKASGFWPRDTPNAQVQYQLWLKKVQDPDTGEFYKQGDKDGNIIKGTGPKHVVRQIVRIRTNNDKEFLFSNGYLIGRVKTRIVGPNSHETVYEMPFNEKNLKVLFEKRITSEDLKLIRQKRMITLDFAVKDERNGVVRDVRDATGIHIRPWTYS